MPDTKTKKRRRGFIPDVRVGGQGMDLDAIRTVASNEPGEFMGKMQKLIDDGDFRWENVTDLKRMYLALGEVQVEATVNVMGEQRVIMASAFPLLSGSLTVAGINEAFTDVPAIGGELVKEIDDNKKVSQFAAILTEDTQILRVDEGKDFPEIGAGEERFEVRSLRNGRRMSITGEMIDENDLANIVSRVNALGSIAGDVVEEQTLKRVYDFDGSKSAGAEPFVHRPNGAGTALYSSTANTPGTRAPLGNRINNNTLVDSTDLDNARIRLATMRNSRGTRISIPMSSSTLLVPDALVGTAAKALNSELEPGVENEVNNWGPRGRWRPQLLSSSKLDDMSATCWHLGNFKKQFVRKWKLRFEFVSLSGDTETFLRSRIAFQSRVAWDVEIGALDYVWVIQNLTASTAPGDE